MISMLPPTKCKTNRGIVPAIPHPTRLEPK
nr:MAG TPA: hypothetical protein [Myoviridae sp. ctfuG5]